MMVKALEIARATGLFRQVSVAHPVQRRDPPRLAITIPTSVASKRRSP